MDTKERKATRRRRGSPREQQRPAGRKPAQDRRRRRPAAARPSRPTAQRRTVRAPKEEIPRAVYTMPQPLRRGKFLMRLVTVVAVVAALMMAVSIFFRVDTVSVLGAEKYTAWMIQEASGIEQGDALLTLSRARAAGKIKSALPYVDEVKVELRLPGTVHIEIRELDVTYAIAAEDGSWWLISADGTAVEQTDAAAARDHTQILGVKIKAPEIARTVAPAADTAPTRSTEPSGETEEGEGETTAPTTPPQIVGTNAQRLEATLTILQALENSGVIGEAASVNVESLIDIRLQYGQRFQVKLGSTEKLDYKIGYMAQAIRQMEEYQAGVLDVSFEYGDQGIFTSES